MDGKRVIFVAAITIFLGGLGGLLLYYSFRGALPTSETGLYSGSTKIPAEMQHNQRESEPTPLDNPVAGGSDAGKTATVVTVRTDATSAAPRLGSVVRATDVISVTLPWDERVSIKVGQKLVAAPPSVGMSWNVEFDATKLELASGLDVSSPPVEGWSWTARQSGTTEIRFSSKAPQCDSKTQPCPNMPSFQTVLLIETSP